VNRWIWFFLVLFGWGAAAQAVGAAGFALAFVRLGSLGIVLASAVLSVVVASILANFLRSHQAPAFVWIAVLLGSLAASPIPGALALSPLLHADGGPVLTLETATAAVLLVVFTLAPAGSTYLALRPAASTVGT